MEFKVILTPQALRDLENIHKYISVDNPTAARQFREKLFAAALSLQSFPGRGSSIKREPEIRFHLCTPYLIVYWIKAGKNIVQILRFWHAARDIGRLRLPTKDR